MVHLWQEGQKWKVMSAFSLDAFRQIVQGLLFLWSRARKLKRELEQVAVCLSGPWWPSTPAGF